MSSVLTVPSADSGLSRPSLGPTTTMLSRSGWMYFAATRATSAAVTFSTAAR